MPAGTGRAALAVAAVGAIAVIVGPTASASAAASAFLTVSAPPSVELGPVAPGGIARGTLGTTQIVESSPDAEGWTATVRVTDFTGRETGAVIPATAFGYTAVDLAADGIAASFDDLTDTIDVTEVYDGTSHSASWSGDVSLAVPPDALADTYTATITTSVL